MTFWVDVTLGLMVASSAVGLAAIVRERLYPTTAKSRIRLDDTSEMHSPPSQDQQPLASSLEQTRYYALRATIARIEAQSAASALEDDLREAARMRDEWATFQGMVGPDRSASFPLMITAVVVLTALNVLPSWWAAEGLLLGETETSFAAIIIAFGGLLAMIGIAHMTKMAWTIQRRAMLLLTLSLIAVEGFLRSHFISASSTGTLTTAISQAVAEVAITAAVIGVGCICLLQSEPYAVWMARRSARHAERRVRRGRQAARAAADLWYSEAALLRHFAHATEEAGSWDNQILAEIRAAEDALRPGR